MCIYPEPLIFSKASGRVWLFFRDPADRTDEPHQGSFGFGHCILHPERQRAFFSPVCRHVTRAQTDVPTRFIQKSRYDPWIQIGSQSDFRLLSKTLLQNGPTANCILNLPPYVSGEKGSRRSELLTPYCLTISQKPSNVVSRVRSDFANSEVGKDSEG